MLDKLVSSKTGVDAVQTLLAEYKTKSLDDGLEFASPADAGLFALKDSEISMPEHLQDFLNDIRLLRRIPLSYLVPDPDLLPPEAIRFFHIDPTWIDRVIDGVLSNINTGSVDFHFGLTILQLIRDATKQESQGSVSGVIIRSELVRRWPNMIVQGYKKIRASIDDTDDKSEMLETLRTEAISRDIFIALFDGIPKEVHIREPFTGIRFGVELAKPQPQQPQQPPSYVVDRRNSDGTQGNANIPVNFRNANLRTLDISTLKESLIDPPWFPLSNMENSRGIALHLEQRPFVQIFRDDVAENKGSVIPPSSNKVPTRKGKNFTLQFSNQALYQTKVQEKKS